MNWSTAILTQKKAAGLIRDFTEHKQSKMNLTETSGRIVAKHFTKKSKEKDYISWNLLMWCNEHALTLEEEYKFDLNGRKFRFDYCIPALKIGIEYNGIMSAKSRHTTISGYSKDMDKLNLAQSQGWRVIQFTPLNYKNLITELNKLYVQIK